MVRKMNRIVLSSVFALLAASWAKGVNAEEFVSHFNIGGKCKVVVIEVIGSNSYTTDYTCEEWGRILDQRIKEREQEELARRAQEKREEEQRQQQARDNAIRYFEDLELWPYINIALNLKGEAQWYPDKRIKAFDRVTSGKTIHEIVRLLKNSENQLEALSLSGFGLLALAEKADREGLGHNKIDHWSYHPYVFCGLKSTVFIVHIVSQTDANSAPVSRDFGFGLDWYYTVILQDGETDATVRPEKDCDD